MSELKRLPVKYIRDYMKKSYKARDCCFVCGNTQQLELHHIYSVSQLFEDWCKKNKIRDITTLEQITQVRELFCRDEEERLSNINLYTLCKSHHQRLHSIYGQKYSNHLANKVIRWLEIQKEKNLG